MKKIALIFMGLTTLIACEKHPAEMEEKPVPQEIRKSKKNVSERFLRIDGETDTLRNFELGKNLFGKFFKERAEFYVIENPNKTIYNHPVKSITLYFLDGTLAKTKYELEQDISDNLIASYGAFTIKGYDTLTRKLFKTEKILQVIDQRKVLNKNLVNYELKWDMNSKSIYTRVDKSGPKKRFEYIEALRNYDRRYKRVEAL